MKTYGQRLKSARIMNGLSLQNLSDKLKNSVSKQALSKYEKDVMKPSGELFLEICNILNVRPDYFTREISVELENIEFRKYQRTHEKQIDAVKEKTKDYLERYLELETLSGVTCNFVNPVKVSSINSKEDAEEAAEQLRIAWNFGENPIPNVIEMLEDNCIKVYETAAPDEFDGLSGFVKENTPLVVLNTYNRDVKPDRKRFTALHELAHLVLNIPANTEHKTKEKLCHAFAGAVLFPKKAFMREFGSHRSGINYKELLILKEKWGMSVQGMVVRARDLGLITSHTYQKFWKDYAHYKKNEPDVFKGEEKSKRFEQLLLRAVAEEKMTLTKAAVLNNMKLAEFRDFLEKI
ncbi:XRE family transcriptional regulator [Cytophagaceae bacterium ABcell3]|nr:XRE family transcriptional regulator [Cytophagaceae bacterium ABcell3]